jgi:hypothetical protein
MNVFIDHLRAPLEVTSTYAAIADFHALYIYIYIYIYIYVLNFNINATGRLSTNLRLFLLIVLEYSSIQNRINIIF